MVARLVPLLDAFARFRPEVPREEVWGWVSFHDPIEQAMALVVEGDAVSDATGVIKTTHFLRDVVPPAPDDTDVTAIFITGDLIAPDAILEEIDSDHSPPFKVFGSVRVRSFFLYGSASRIDGDLVASDTVFGFYNHGNLEVGGDLRARVLLDFDYTWEVGGIVDCEFVLGRFHRANFTPTHPAEDFTKVLVWDAVTDCDDIAYGFVWDALTRGEPILRSPGEIGTAPVPQLGRIARERLAEAAARRDGGEEVTAIDLKACELRFVPEDLRAFPALRRLVLDDNRIVTLPPWFDELRKVEELSLKDCGLTVIPDSLASLPELRVLALDGNPLVGLAEGAGLPPALQVLSIGSRHHFGTEDDGPDPDLFIAGIDLSTLPRIRIVEQEFSEGIHYGDSRLWDSPTLESLNLNFNAPIILPSGLSEAMNLRVLGVALDGDDLDRSIAVLAALPRLELLYLDMFTKLSREQFDRVCTAVPRAFLRHWSVDYGSSAREEWLRRRIAGTSAEEQERAVDDALAGVELRRCFGGCEEVEYALRLKAEMVLGAALAKPAPPEAASAAADWGDPVSDQIPDLGDLLWRHPFADLALVRSLAVLAGLLRPGRADARAGLATLRSAVERNSVDTSDYRHGIIRSWLDRAQAHLG